jgi:ABC-type uncharacterized transport system ATPase subunit
MLSHPAAESTQAIARLPQTRSQFTFFLRVEKRIESADAIECLSAIQRRAAEILGVLIVYVGILIVDFDGSAVSPHHCFRRSRDSCERGIALEGGKT